MGTGVVISWKPHNFFLLFHHTLMGATGYFTHSDCRLHEMGAGHPECPQRLDAIEDRLLITGLDHALERREPSPASLADIELAHDRMYVASLLSLIHI